MQTARRLFMPLGANAATRLLPLLACAMVPRAFAVPITYPLTGTVTAGSITNPLPGMYRVPAITNTLTLAGDETTGIVTVYLNTNTGTVAFGNIPGGGVGLTGSSSTSWNLAFRTGPARPAHRTRQRTPGFKATLALTGPARAPGRPPCFNSKLCRTLQRRRSGAMENVAQEIPIKGIDRRAPGLYNPFTVRHTNGSPGKGECL